MFNHMVSIVPPNKIKNKKMKSILVKKCDHYSSNKQYSCELYINTNPLSRVGTKCG